MLSEIMFSLFLREVYWFFTYHRIIYLAQYTNYICFQFHKNHCTESSPHVYWIKKHIIILWLYSYDNFNKYLIIAQFIPVKKYKIVCVLWCTTSLYWLWFWSTSHVLHMYGLYSPCNLDLSAHATQVLVNIIYLCI